MFVPVSLAALPIENQLWPLTAWLQSCSWWSSLYQFHRRWPSLRSPADRTTWTGKKNWQEMNSWSNFCLHDDRPKGILTKGIIHCWVIVRIKIPQFHCPVYLNVFLMKYNWFITAFLKTSHIYIHCTVNLICKYSLYGSKNPPLKHNVYILPKICRKSNKCLRIKHLLFILAKRLE